MAKTHDENFCQLLEKAKTIVQQGKHPDAIRFVLKHMSLDKDENNTDLYPFISDIPLARRLGIPDPQNNGRKKVYRVRKDLKDKRLNRKKIKNKIDSSGTEHIGEGDEFVYLFYFRPYKQYAESEDLNYWQCNIGHTQDNPEDRVASQIGGQLPEKPTLSLVMQTNDCKTLEKLIHDELKRRGRHLDPKSGADVVGVEWFSTNPAEVKGIFMYQQAKKFCDEFKYPEEWQKMDEAQFEEVKPQFEELNQQYLRNSEIVKEFENRK